MGTAFSLNYITKSTSVSQYLSNNRNIEKKCPLIYFHVEKNIAKYLKKIFLYYLYVHKK